MKQISDITNKNKNIYCFKNEFSYALKFPFVKDELYITPVKIIKTTRKDYSPKTIQNEIKSSMKNRSLSPFLNKKIEKDSKKIFFDKISNNSQTNEIKNSLPYFSPLHKRYYIEKKKKIEENINEIILINNSENNLGKIKTNKIKFYEEKIERLIGKHQVKEKNQIKFNEKIQKKLDESMIRKNYYNKLTKLNIEVKNIDKEFKKALNKVGHHDNSCVFIK